MSGPARIRIGLTGAAGMLGREIVREAAARPSVELMPWTRASFDLTNEAATHRVVLAARPDVVIHAAAWTDVDGCEGDPARAMRENGTGTDVLAPACRDLRRAARHRLDRLRVRRCEAAGPISEGDATAPLNAYGRSKGVAEEATLATRAARHRGAHRVGLRRPRKELLPHDAAARRDAAAPARRRRSERLAHVRGGSRRRRSWTWRRRRTAGARAASTTSRTRARPRGTDSRGASSKLAGKSVDVERCTSSEFPRPAKRPTNSVLADTRRAAAGLPPMPSWDEGLRRCSARLASPS